LIKQYSLKNIIPFFLGKDAYIILREGRDGKMKKKFFALAAVLLLTAGCAALEPLEVREEMYGKGVPVVTQSFASKEIRPGDTWKVYLNAHDPDGDMKQIVCVIQQTGVGVYPASYTRIKEGKRQELSGYIYLPTLQVNYSSFNFINLTLRVEIQDRAGHYSAPLFFPLGFNALYRQESPPQNVFKENDLGPIMIQLRTVDDGSVRDD
jgi:hypothetical protein